MEDPNYKSSHTTWGIIISYVKSLKQKGIDLLALCVRNIGNGVSCRFWEDTWVGNMSLKILFPCVYKLDTDKACTIADRLPIQDWDSVLIRQPRGDAEESQLKDLKSLI